MQEQENLRAFVHARRRYGVVGGVIIDVVSGHPTSIEAPGVHQELIERLCAQVAEFFGGRLTRDNLAYFAEQRGRAGSSVHELALKAGEEGRLLPHVFVAGRERSVTGNVPVTVYGLVFLPDASPAHVQICAREVIAQFEGTGASP